MFWDKVYTPSQNIENLLQKDNVTVEEFLDDDDILQECKSQKKNLVQYLTRPDVIKRLIELTITEPPEDVSINQRFKHANMACEILTFGLPSLDEKLVEDEELLQTLYSYLEKEPPLNPLLSSFFNKTFSMLISRKAETDWFLYQKMCLQVLEFLKSRGNFLDLIFRHFATPVIMDLLLQIIREVQGALKKDLYEWLTEQNLVERLITLLGQPEESEKHKIIAEFLCELIRHGRSMRQAADQQENDSFQQIFVSGNPLLLSIENYSAISQLVEVMLKPDANETTVVAGVKILLTLADESIVDEPASDLALQLIMDKEKDNHERIISIIIETIEPKVNDFHNLLLKSPKKNHLININSDLPPPFGITRLQICSLFTILIRVGNSKIIDAICKTDLFETLLKLFKEYCWNNFLHSEVEKCLRYVFCNKKNIYNNNNDNNNQKINQINKSQIQTLEKQNYENNDNENSNGDRVEDPEIYPSALQIYAIVNCKIISKLIECWILNKELQSTAKGRRLGYMGHLIKIFDIITTSILESEKLGALIESNLSEEELLNWKVITKQDEGELIKDLTTQKRMLADCNAYESAEFNTNLPKEFHNENFSSEFFNDTSSNLPAFLEDDPIYKDFLSTEFYEQFKKMDFESNVRNFLTTFNINTDLPMSMKQGSADEETNIDNANSPNAFAMNASPWGTDPFNSFSDNANDGDSNGWNKSNNEFFADFDSHFNDFDLGINNGAPKKKNSNIHREQNSINLKDFQSEPTEEQLDIDKFDNNANFEKMCNDKLSTFDFDFDNTNTNAEKLIASIVNDDNSDIIGVEIDDVIGEGNGKMQTDDDDIVANKIDENNSFNKVQEDVLNTTNNVTIKNSASNGPLNDGLINKLSSTHINTEVNEKITQSSNNSTDHFESDDDKKSSTTKDITSNSIENSSDALKEDLAGGCDVAASVADESS